MKKQDIEGVKGAPIGSFTNFWRRRRVFVYEHIGDPTKVVTIGVAVDGGTDCDCIEDRSAYQGRIDNNNWSDYN